MTSGFSNAAKTEYPLTIKTVAAILPFNQAPTRVATVGQNSTEILYSLGLADRVVGTSLWFGQYWMLTKQQMKKLPLLRKIFPALKELWLKTRSGCQPI